MPTIRARFLAGLIAAGVALAGSGAVALADGVQAPWFAPSPFDQMKAAGITYTTAGENIAGNQSVEATQAALMNSPGHRANILSSAFTKVGIGIIHGGPYGLMVTQQFIG